MVYPGPSSDRLEAVAKKLLGRSDVDNDADALALIQRMTEDAPRYESHYRSVGKTKELLWWAVDFDPEAKLAKSKEEELEELLGSG